jgi:hypothetical protein
MKRAKASTDEGRRRSPRRHGPEQQHPGASRDQQRYGQTGHGRVGALAGEHADHQQRQSADGDDQLRIAESERLELERSGVMPVRKMALPPSVRRRGLRRPIGDGGNVVDSAFTEAAVASRTGAG